MAKGTKPGTKPEALENETELAPKKSKKKLIIIVVVIVTLVAAGVVAALLLLKPAHKRDGDTEEVATEQHAEEHKAPPKYVELGTYTTNLAPDEGDRFVQAEISFKISKPELEESIKATKPELQHRINMLLQSSLPSELSTTEGKNRLAEQIKEQAQEVLGLRPTVAATGDEHSAATKKIKIEDGLDEVLFTSFLIQ